MKKDVFTSSGTQNRGSDTQEMYSKNTTNEGHVEGAEPRGYEPTHTINKNTGDIPGAKC